MKKNLNRRDFLRMSALTAAGAALAGCGATPTPEVVEKEVVKTVEVEKTVEVIKEVEVPVEETVIVEVTAEPPPTPVPVTIKYWRHFTPSGEKTTKDILNTFKYAAPEITVEFDPVPDNEYEQRLSVATAAGEGPDIFQLNEAMFPRFYGKELLAPVDLGVYGLASVDEFEARFLPNVMNPTIMDGTPHMGGIAEYGTWFIAYNLDAFDKAGVEYPSDEKVLTWDEYYDMATKLSLYDGDRMTQMGEGQWITGQDNPAGCYIIHDPIFKQNGGDAFDTETGKPINKEVWEKAAQTMADCALGGKYGYVDTGFPTSFNAHPEMFNDRMAMLMAGIWAEGWGMSVNPDLRIAFAPYPAVDEANNAAFAGYWGWVVSAQAAPENQMAAWKWAAFLDNDDNCFKWFDEAKELHPRTVPGLKEHMVEVSPGMKVQFNDVPRGRLPAGIGKDNMTQHWDLIRANLSEPIFKLGTDPAEAIDNTWQVLEDASTEWS